VVAGAAGDVADEEEAETEDGVDLGARAALPDDAIADHEPVTTDTEGTEDGELAEAAEDEEEDEDKVEVGVVGAAATFTAAPLFFGLKVGLRF
jgi:hypothetical protein